MNNRYSDYRIIQKLGFGTNHQVFKVLNSQNDKLFAMKIENNPNIGQIDSEVKKLKELSSLNGIPKIIDYGKTKDNKSFIVIPLLKKNLQQIAKENVMTIPCIVAIGLSILDTLEQVHKKNILHLDIKPENIMITSEYINVPIIDILNPGFVQLIDFGLARKTDTKESKTKVFIGSLRYSSRQAHKGGLLSFRDDLESLLYVLVYLRNFNLPWQQLKQLKSQQQEIRQIGEMKETVFGTRVLTSNFPEQMTEFKNYIDTLKERQMPNYSYMKELFRSMLKIESRQNQKRITETISQSSTNQENKELNSDNYQKFLERFPKNISLDQDEEGLDDDENSIILVSERIKTFNSIPKKLITELNI